MAHSTVWNYKLKLFGWIFVDMENKTLKCLQSIIFTCKFNLPCHRSWSLTFWAWSWSWPSCWSLLLILSTSEHEASVWRVLGALECQNTNIDWVVVTSHHQGRNAFYDRTNSVRQVRQNVFHDWNILKLIFHYPSRLILINGWFTSLLSGWMFHLEATSLSDPFG